jgi:high-affinity iron transporter
MLASLLLMFREVLEASLVVGIACAASRGLPGRWKWIAAGLFMGLVGAVAVGLGASRIADAFDGRGQEWLNAGVLLGAAALIGWHVAWMSKHGRELGQRIRSAANASTSASKALVALAGIIALAIWREGSEVVLFGYGLLLDGTTANGLVLGAGLGLLAGVGCGLGVYLGLLRIPMKYFFGATNGVLMLMAAGMAAAGAGYLSQDGTLPLSFPVWDTRWLLDDNTVAGKVIHTLLGYSDQPTGLQVVAYISVLLALVSVTQNGRQKKAGTANQQPGGVG